MRTIRTSVVGVLTGLAAAGASGQTWDGGAADDFWTTGANWSGNVVPVNNGTAALVYSSTGNLAPNSIVNQNWSIASLAFNSGATAYLLNGTGTLTIGSGGITNNDPNLQRLDMNAIALAANQTWNASAGPLTIEPNVFSLGTRTLTVTGSFNTTITTGILQMTGTGSVIKNGTGTLFWNGGTYGGNVVINAGELDVGIIDAWSATTDVSLAAGATLDLSGWGQGMDQLTGTGTVLNNGNNAFIVLGEGNSSFTLGATIRGSGEIRKKGTGTLTLASSFDSNCPDFHVMEGTLATEARLANPAMAVTVDPNATVDISPLLGSAEEFGALAGGGNVAVAQHSSLKVGANNADTTFSGELGGLGSFRKAGSGVLTLSGASTLNTWFVDAGTLRMATVGSCVPDAAAITMTTGSTLDLASEFEAIGQLVGAGTVVNNAGGFQVGDANDFAFTGTIGGTGGVTKVGAGAWTLGGAGAVNGALRVAAGALVLATPDQNTIGDAVAVTIDPNAVLDLNNTGELFGSLAGDGDVINNNGSGIDFGFNNTSTTFAGAISGDPNAWSAGEGQVVKRGTGTFTLNGSISSASIFKVLAGRVELGTGDTIANNVPVEIAAGAVMDMNGDEEVIGALSGGGNVENANARFELNAATSTTYSGVVSGTGFLNKDGSGVWTVSGANTLSGDWNIREGKVQKSGTANIIPNLSTVNISAGAGLDLGNEGEEIGALAGAGEVSNAGCCLISPWFEFGGNNLSTAFSGSIGSGGVHNVRKKGTGVWTLSGTAVTGWFTIAQGSVSMAGAGVMDTLVLEILSGASFDLNGTAQSVGGLIGAGTVLNSNAAGLTLDSNNPSQPYNFSGVIIGSGPVIKAGTSTQTLAGANQFNGTSGLFIDGGVVKLGLPDVDVLPESLPVTVAAGATLDMNGTGESFGSLAGDGAVINNTAAAGLDIGNNNASTTFTGDISGTAVVRKDGTGTWTLGGTISGGSDLLIGAGVVKLAAGVDLANNCDVLLVNGDLNMDSWSDEFGALSGGLGRLVLHHNGVMYMHVGANQTFQGTITGADANTPGSGTLVKDGSARWTLEGGLNITGRLDIYNGTVALWPGATVNNQLDVSISSGTTFDLGGNSVVIASLSGAGNVTNNNSPGRLQILGSASKRHSGVISGNGPFMMSGTGVQELAGASTYSGGTSVNRGVLLVNNTSGSGLGSGNVSIAGLGGLATLGGDGLVSGATTIASLGKLAPGGTTTDLSDAGSLAFGSNLTFQAGSMLDVELGGANPGTQYDQVIVAGTANLAGAATLKARLIDGFVPTPGQTFTVLTAGSRSGQFASLDLPPQFSVAYNATSIVLTYNGQPGDADGDCDVDQDDIDIVLFHFLQNVPPGTNGDLDGDGDVDQDDIDLVLFHYGDHC